MRYTPEHRNRYSIGLNDVKELAQMHKRFCVRARLEICSDRHTRISRENQCDMF
jgi:hypothetical protein